MFTEVEPLAVCLTLAPGAEFDRMTPHHIEPGSVGADGNYVVNPDYLLFDDLVLLAQLQVEHAELTAVIRAATGERGTYDLRTLLHAVLADPTARAAIVDEVLDFEVQLGTQLSRVRSLRARLLGLDPVALAVVLLSGSDPHDQSNLLHFPAPNWLFARDLGAMIGNAVVLGYPRARARKRDGILARGLVNFHPLFAAVDRLDIRPGLGRISDNEINDLRCIEGGDLLVVAADTVLIGVGERTTLHAAQALAQLLWDRGVQHVLAVHLPQRRAMMHLDTVFTLIDHHAALLFPAAFSSESPGGDRVHVVDLQHPQRDLGCDLPLLLAERGHPITTVPCGDGDPLAAAREQWSDGANAFCLAPGIIVLYQRNTRTLRALNRQGYEVLTASQFVANADLLLASARRVVVALAGSELSRGRGGPRCLTWPLSRRSRMDR